MHYFLLSFINLVLEPYPTHIKIMIKKIRLNMKVNIHVIWFQKQ